MSKDLLDDTVPCPHCGADISQSATFCRHCGASDADGWAESDDSGDYDDDFDYDCFVEEEFGSDRVTNTSIPLGYRIVALILLGSIFFAWVVFGNR